MLRLGCILLLLGALGCSMAPMESARFARDSQAMPSRQALAAKATEAGPPGPPPPKPSSDVADARKVIYMASLTLVSDNLQASIAKARQLAETAGGHMQDMTLDSITLRVPSPKFQELLSQFEGLGTVIQRNVLAQDVTEQYADLDLRLKNAQAYMDKLTQLLAQAENVTTTIELEREISKVRGEIEQMEAQIARMKTQIDLASVTLRFVPISSAPASVKTTLPFYWLNTLGLDDLLEF